MPRRGQRMKALVTRWCAYCGDPLPWWRENTCNNECHVLHELGRMGEWIDD